MSCGDEVKQLKAPTRLNVQQPPRSPRNDYLDNEYIIQEVRLVFIEQLITWSAERGCEGGGESRRFGSWHTHYTPLITCARTDLLLDNYTSQWLISSTHQKKKKACKDAKNEKSGLTV